MRHGSCEVTSVTAEVCGGTHFDQARRDAAMLALELETAVDFQFNGKDFRADPKAITATVREIPPPQQKHHAAEHDKAPTVNKLWDPEKCHRERAADPLDADFEVDGRQPAAYEGPEFTAKAHTDHHWQIRRLHADGTLWSIWNVYPTKRKVCVDPHHPGPQFKLPDPLTLENFRTAAMNACALDEF